MNNNIYRHHHDGPTYNLIRLSTSFNYLNILNANWPTCFLLFQMGYEIDDRELLKLENYILLKFR